MVFHQDFEEGEAVHLWHFNIQSDDVGLKLEDLVASDVWVARCAHDFQVWIGAKDIAHHFSHHHRVVHDEDFDFLRVQAHFVAFL